MPVAMECEAITKISEFMGLLPPCMHCGKKFEPGQYALSLYERWRHRMYMVHDFCEVPLIQELEAA